MAEFLAMGGYAWYVWPAYGLTAIVLIANLLLPLRHRRHLLRQLRTIARQRTHNGRP